MKSVVFWPIRRYAADCVGTIPETMISWRCAAAIRSRRRRSSGVVSELRLSGRIGTGTPARTPRGARAGDRPSTRRSYRPAARSCRPPPPPASAAPPHPAPAAAAAAARRGATVLLPVLRYTYSPRPGPAMNLRTARAERGAVQPKGYVSFSERAGRGWNVRWRASSHAQKPVKSPRQDFSTFLTPVRVPQCRRRVQESGTVNLTAAELVIHSSASSCCGTPSAATPGSRSRRPQSRPAGLHVSSFHTNS